MKIIFASDFHLKHHPTPDEYKRMERVLAFLQGPAAQADTLVLLGDIFDLWYAWDSVVIKDYLPVICAFRQLLQKGVTIHYLAGNHDFWKLDYFANMGIKVHADDFCLKTGTYRVFCSHGDMHTINDMRYRVFRGLIRTRLASAIFSLLHPDLGMRLGGLMSRSSRRYTEKEQNARKKAKFRREHGLQNKARAQLAKGFELVVMGHTHTPVKEEYPGGLYVNTGDFITHNTYLCVTKTDCQLITYKMEEKC